MLVDTRGWVDFLRSGSGMLSDQAERAMAEDRACLCRVSVADLLQGGKGQKERRQLEMLFDSVPGWASSPQTGSAPVRRYRHCAAKVFKSR